MLLVMGLVKLGANEFIVLNFFTTMFLVGAHFGLHSVAGVFYPSAYRANGAGWATSIAKIGSIAGPVIGGVALSSRLPAKSTFAVLAVCPLIVGVAMYIVGQLEKRMSRDGQRRRWAKPVASLATDVGVPD